MTADEQLAQGGVDTSREAVEALIDTIRKDINSNAAARYQPYSDGRSRDAIRMIEALLTRAEAAVAKQASLQARLDAEALANDEAIAARDAARADLAARVEAERVRCAQIARQMFPQGTHDEYCDSCRNGYTHPGGEDIATAILTPDPTPAYDAAIQAAEQRGRLEGREQTAANLDAMAARETNLEAAEQFRKWAAAIRAAAKGEQE